MPSIYSGARGTLNEKTVRLHGDRLQVVVSQSCFSAVVMLGLPLAPKFCVYWIAACKTTVVARIMTRILGPGFVLVHQ